MEVIVWNLRSLLCTNIFLLSWRVAAEEKYWGAKQSPINSHDWEIFGAKFLSSRARIRGSTLPKPLAISSVRIQLDSCKLSQVAHKLNGGESKHSRKLHPKESKFYPNFLESCISVLMNNCWCVDIFNAFRSNVVKKDLIKLISHSLFSFPCQRISISVHMTIIT